MRGWLAQSRTHFDKFGGSGIPWYPIPVIFTTPPSDTGSSGLRHLTDAWPQWWLLVSWPGSGVQLRFDRVILLLMSTVPLENGYRRDYRKDGLDDLHEEES